MVSNTSPPPVPPASGPVVWHRIEGLWSVAVAVAVRPGLWGVAIRQLLVMARPRWWRHWPPMPVPDPAYLSLRLQTAYGRPDAPLVATDVIGYLRWCRAWPRVAGPRH